MKFEWDEHKNGLNQRKHGVSFEEAKEIFADPYIYPNWIIALVILKNDGLLLAQLKADTFWWLPTYFFQKTARKLLELSPPVPQICKR